MQRKLRRRLADEEIGDEVFMPTSTIPIPIGKKNDYFECFFNINVRFLANND